MVFALTAAGAALALPPKARAQLNVPLAGSNEIEQRVEVRERAFARTMVDRDFEAFLTFVSAEAVFFAGEVPLRGREAVAEAWRPFFDGPRAPFGWEPDRVVALESGTLALSTGPVTGPAGEALGRFNSIWRLEPDGVWRVVFDKGS